MSEINPFAHVECRVGGVVGTVVDVEATVSVDLDRYGHRSVALMLREGTLTVPAGVKAELEIVVEHASDAAFSDVEILGDYADCPQVCCYHDNSDGTAPYSDFACLVAPLRCIEIAKRFVRAKVTLRGAGVVALGGSSTVDWLISGKPVVNSKGGQ